MVEKAKDKYISIFEFWNSCNMSFDLWMSKAKMDTFVFIVHFLTDKWVPCHVTIDFFETTKNFRLPWLLQVNEMFVNMAWMVGLLLMLKTRGIIFQPWPLHWFLLFHVLGLITPFVGTSWGHVMSKCCQFAIDDSKVCVSLTFLSIKKTWFILHRIITWTKKNGNGWQEWNKACLAIGVLSQKLKILMKTWFAFWMILF